jgi:outer membrane protein assembly factor BamB
MPLQSPRPLAARWLAPLALALTACAAQGPQLRLETSSAPASGVSSVLAPALVPAPTPGAATPALALGNDGKRLVGAPLDAVLRWHDVGNAIDAALLAPPIVIASEGKRLAARAAPTGGGFWTIAAPEGQLWSASDDGAATAVGLRLPRRGESRVIVYDRKGASLLQITSQERLGTPALLRGRLYLPWSQDSLSVIDVEARRELTRVRLPGRADHALSSAAGELVLVGGLRYFPLRGGPVTAVSLPARPLPGTPATALPYDVEPLLAPALASTPRLIADPQRVMQRTGHYLYVHDRISLGLNLDGARLDWLHVAPQRVLAAAALASGFVLCDAAGTLFVLGDDGSVLDRIQLSPGRLQSCAIRPGLLRSPEASPRSAGPLIDQLAAALRLTDPELVELQRFLLNELAARPEPEATRLLLDIAGNAMTQLTLQSDAADLLALRRNGVEYMLKALGQDTTGGAQPPVRALADALAGLDVREATPLLVKHLNDPTHSSETIAHVMKALEKLAGPADYEPVRVFFLLHRATADDPEWVEASVAAARTLLRIGGEPGKSVVQLAADDPLTVAAIRGELTKLLASATTAQRPAAAP